MFARRYRYPLACDLDRWLPPEPLRRTRDWKNQAGATATGVASPRASTTRLKDAAAELRPGINWPQVRVGRTD